MLEEETAGEQKNVSVTCLTGRRGWSPATVGGGRLGRSFSLGHRRRRLQRVVICLRCVICPQAGGWLRFTSC